MRCGQLTPREKCLQLLFQLSVANVQWLMSCRNEDSGTVFRLLYGDRR